MPHPKAGLRVHILIAYDQQAMLYGTQGIIINGQGSVNWKPAECCRPSIAVGGELSACLDEALAAVVVQCGTMYSNYPIDETQQL